MDDIHECSGCYMWENKIDSVCDFTPRDFDSKEIICPCVECLVKSMCTESISCKAFRETFNHGEGVEWTDD